MNKRLTVGLLLAAVVALALRCPRLDERPMHNDEAVNAIKFGQLWEHGVYRYDPNEHHGPALFYATLAVARLTSTPDFEHLTETKLRLITVAFGLGLIVLLPLISDGLGQRAAIWAGVFTAVSPAMVFYSRYYIHEMLLVFFPLLILAAGWRYWQTRKAGYALLAGAGAGLLHATKETFVISLAAGALALGANQAWNRMLDASSPPVRRRPINFMHLAAALAVWVLVALTLFSSFFTNPSGPLDSVRTYLPWAGRAGGDSPHVHPWHFYLHRLIFLHAPKGPIWSEALILALALLGAGAAFARKGLADANASFVRFLALYTFALTAAYSFISYKTPWCLLSFWHGMILLAGVGAAVAVRVVGQASRLSVGRLAPGAGNAGETPGAAGTTPAPLRKRLLVRGALNRVAPVWHWRGRLACLLLFAGTAHLAWQAWQAGVPYAADQRNPYVYAQTSPDILKLIRRVEALAAVHPQGHQMLLKVIAAESDYWPLPWYLRAFKQIGWWDAMPADPFAPVMIVSSKFRAELDERKTHLMTGYFELRPQVFMELYVQLDLWRNYLKQNPTGRPE
jgi:uncharacterized protein (TIGR03663 family)